MITLRIIGVLYLLSGLWCLFQYEPAAQYLGFDLATSLAASEFMSVYGGLQIGLALGMFIGASIKAAQFGALLMALLVSVSLACARVLSFVVHPDALAQSGAWMLAALEITIAVSLGWAFRRYQLAAL